MQSAIFALLSWQIRPSVCPSHSGIAKKKLPLQINRVNVTINAIND